MSEFFTERDLDDFRQYRTNIEAANRNNILCHCRQCDRQWVASNPEPCVCRSTDVETIVCWQFPDG